MYKAYENDNNNNNNKLKLTSYIVQHPQPEQRVNNTEQS